METFERSGKTVRRSMQYFRVLNIKNTRCMSRMSETIQFSFQDNRHRHEDKFKGLYMNINTSEMSQDWAIQEFRNNMLSPPTRLFWITEPSNTFVNIFFLYENGGAITLEKNSHQNET